MTLQSSVFIAWTFKPSLPLAGPWFCTNCFSHVNWCPFTFAFIYSSLGNHKIGLDLIRYSVIEAKSIFLSCLSLCDFVDSGSHRQSGPKLLRALIPKQVMLIPWSLTSRLMWCSKVRILFTFMQILSPLYFHNFTCFNKKSCTEFRHHPRLPLFWHGIWNSLNRNSHNQNIYQGAVYVGSWA